MYINDTFYLLRCLILSYVLLTAEFVSFEPVRPHTSTLMCSFLCKGFEHHLVLTGEGWGLTVPGFLAILFFLFLFAMYSFFFLNGLFNILENTNVSRLFEYSKDEQKSFKQSANCDVPFVSWNVKSLNHPIKRKKVLTYLSKLKVGIAFLQETHL